MRTLYRKGFVGGPYGFIVREGPTGGGGAPVLLSIAVTPSNSTLTPLSASDTQQMTATGTYSSGPPQDITATVTWSSGTPGTATIDAAGLATPVGTGSTVITAQLGAVSGNTNLTVDTDRDATSGKRVPANAYQFSLGGYTVAHIFPCQEASGNLVDVISGLTLTANATPLYQQAVPGWTRTASAFNQTASQRFAAGAGTGPNPATTDVFWCSLEIADTLPSGVRGMLAVGANCVVNYVNATGALRLSVAGVTVDDTTTRPDLSNAVFPLGLQQDATNSRTGMFTDAAKTAGTHAAATDGTKGIGGNAVGSASTPALSGSLYIFVMTGANARMSDAQVKALYEWLGFTVPWS